MTYQFSRVNPPRVLIPTNFKHLGAQNILIPVEYKASSGKIRRVMKPQVIEHDTVFEDFNKCRETPLHPPFEAEPQASEIIQGAAFQVNSFIY